MQEELQNPIAELQEKLRRGEISRRDFLRYASLLGLSLGAAQALAACSPAATPTTAPAATATPVPAATATSAPVAAAPEPETVEVEVEVFKYPGYAWDPPYAGLHVQYERCSGCRICEGACSIKNFGEFNPELSRVRVYHFNAGVIAVPSICWGCQWQGGAANGGLDAPCVEICPTDPKALTWHETLNIPVVHEDLCIQCGLCYDNCAQYAIKENPKTGFPNVCTRCDGDPECVKQCPTQALQPRKSPAGIEGAYGRRTIESVAESIAETRYYGWLGLEDWKKVGGA